MDRVSQDLRSFETSRYNHSTYVIGSPRSLCGVHFAHHLDNRVVFLYL